MLMTKDDLRIKMSAMECADLVVKDIRDRIYNTAFKLAIGMNEQYIDVDIMMKAVIEVINERKECYDRVSRK